MRTVSDETIQAQAQQPDIQYLSDIQLMDVADSLNYSYDDYRAFVACVKEQFMSHPFRIFDANTYAAHRAAIHAQGQEYLAACIENAGPDTIIGAHW